MKDWHKLILVYLAGRKTKASPKNIEQYLKNNKKSKSLTAITTACQETLSDILTCHDQSLYNDNGAVRTKRFQYSLKTDPETVHIMVTKAFDHDRDLQNKFMRSQYYSSMTPELVHQFEDSIPDNDLGMLTRALEENWIALKFITHFISAKDDEKGRILHQLFETHRNPHISPAAAQSAGGKKGFCLGMDMCEMWIRDNAQLPYRKERIKAEMNNDIPHINWGELFNQLDHLNSNYQYLFD